MNMVCQNPPVSDVIAAGLLVEISANTGIFPSVHTYFTDAEGKEWPEGHLSFNRHFGQSREFFQGAIEYVRLATGWHLRPHQVLVQVSDRRTEKGVSGVPHYI